MERKEKLERHGKKWTEDEEYFLVMYYYSLGKEFVANILGRTIASVSWKFHNTSWVITKI